MTTTQDHAGRFVLSRYAHIIPLDGETSSILYSAATTSLARIPRELGDLLLASPDRIVPDSIVTAEQLGDGLRRHGFIVPAGLDEVARAVLPLRHTPQPDSWLGVTIAPTMGCNFDCPYCFEAKDSSRLMSEATADQVVAFIVGRLDGKERLSLSWYGGEPTLGIRRIEQITRGLAPALEAQPVKVFTEIITNGYNLDADMRARLAACGVSRYQITLDGPRHIHDQRRHLKNGGPTFDRIVENIRGVMASADVDIRVNIDQDNAAAIDDMIAVLEQEGLLTHCTCGFAHVDAITDSSARYGEHCLAMVDFSQVVGGLYERNDSALGLPPLPGKPHTCGAIHSSSFVIDPDGAVSRCWTTIGDARECIGNVNAPADLHFTDSFQAFDLLADERCRACDILPICLGGCPYKFMRSTGDERCVKWKFSLYRSLRQYCSAVGKAPPPPQKPSHH